MHNRHLMIMGRVQGVSYRAWFVREGRKHGLKGWVRNRVDGSVEAHISGVAENVDAMIAAAHEGPEYARVDRIDVKEDACPLNADDMVVLPTI